MHSIKALSNISISGYSGEVNLGFENEVTVSLATPCSDSTSYTISSVLRNDVDATPSIYAWSIVDRTPSSFTVNFSGIMDSTNYYLEWIVCEGDLKDNYDLAIGASQVTVPLPVTINEAYTLIANIATTEGPGSSIYSPLIVEKDTTSFTVQFSGAIDSTNYYISWVIPAYDTYEIQTLEYYQSGGFRDFDEEGTFDCTHGFDLVQITIEDIGTSFMLNEDDTFLLQETGDMLRL